MQAEEYAHADNDAMLKLLGYEAVASVILQCDKNADPSKSLSKPASSAISLTGNAIHTPNRHVNQSRNRHLRCVDSKTQRFNHYRPSGGQSNNHRMSRDQLHQARLMSRCTKCNKFGH